MKEREYILATNLEKLIAARNTLLDVTTEHNGIINTNDWGAMLKLLYKWQTDILDAIHITPDND